MKHFVLQAGGYSRVRFVVKDLYNRFDKEIKKEITSGMQNLLLHICVGRKIETRYSIMNMMWMRRSHCGDCSVQTHVPGITMKHLGCSCDRHYISNE